MVVSCKSAINDAAPTTVPNITAIVARYDGGGHFSQVSVAVVNGNPNQITAAGEASARLICKI